MRSSSFNAEPTGIPTFSAASLATVSRAHESVNREIVMNLKFIIKASGCGGSVTKMSSAFFAEAICDL